MEQIKNSPRSIKLLFMLSKVAFWLSAVATVIAFVWFLYAAFGGVVDFQVGSDEVEYKTTIKVDSENEDLVSIKEADNIESNKVLPPYLKNTIIFKSFGSSLLVLAILFFFKKFMSKVYKGKYFDADNISMLKRIAYLLAGIWVFELIIKGIIASGKLAIERDVDFIFRLEAPSWYILLAALFVWILSHIFMKGIELKEDNDLTV